MEQGPDAFGSGYAQNLVSCLYSVMKREGRQDERGHTQSGMFESSVRYPAE